MKQKPPAEPVSQKYSCFPRALGPRTRIQFVPRSGTKLAFLPVSASVHLCTPLGHTFLLCRAYLLGSSVDWLLLPPCPWRGLLPLSAQASWATQLSSSVEIPNFKHGECSGLRKQP